MKRSSKQPPLGGTDFEVVNRLSFWKILDLRYQLGLRRWAVDVKRRMVACGRDEQRLDQQMQSIASARLWPSVLGANQCVQLALPAPLQPQVTDQQIESIAQKAVKRLSSDQEWDDWRGVVRSKLPSYAAEEVIRRADEIRGLSDDEDWDDPIWSS